MSYVYRSYLMCDAQVTVCKAGSHIDASGHSSYAYVTLMMIRNATEGLATAAGCNSLTSERRILLWMCLLVGVNQLGFGAMVPSLPLYASSFGVPASAIGIAVAAYGLARFLAIFPGGRLADSWGRRPVLAIAGLISAI